MSRTQRVPLWVWWVVAPSRAAALAAVVSVTAEAQLYSTTRFPSTTDVTAAVAGAAIGAVAAALVAGTTAGGEERASPAK